jgi:prephenate dehydrogenase
MKTPKRVLLAGTGLMGGSIGLGLRQAWPQVERLALDPANADAAVAAGAADRVCSDSDLAQVDLVVMSVPVSASAGVLDYLAMHLAEGSVVTDVGSTKASVVQAARAVLPSGVSFVGGHPMAGSELSGIEAARADLFSGAWWVLTPTAEADAEAVRAVLGLVSALGARSLLLEPAAHDSLVATVSHLPQLLASSLMRFASDQGKDRAALRALAAGGFRDMTRIAASRPDIWIDICRENADSIVPTVRAFAQELIAVADAVEAKNDTAVADLFEQARSARQALPAKSGVGDLVEVRIDIPDRPGVLADVTTTVGELGVNIEDLSIDHAADGGHGVLSLFVRSDAPRSELLDALRSLGLVVR